MASLDLLDQAEEGMYFDLSLQMICHLSKLTYTLYRRAPCLTSAKRGREAL